MRALKVFFRRPQIMRNVEITINSVRMIYRDSTTVPTRPFELIASMASLGIQSCDASWTPAVLGEDDEGQLFRKLVTVSELSVSFECAGVREELLRPLTAELKMENYADGEPRKSGGRPAGVAQHTLRFSLDQVELQFSKLALVCCVTLAQKSDLRAYLAYVQYRPAERPSRATARDWWQYALRGATYVPAARNKVMAQKRWTDLSWQVGARAEYLRMYKATRRRPVAGLNVQPTPVSEEDKAALQALDDRFDTRAIALFRRVAIAELDVERETTKEALRSYKRVKEDSMGSSISRMKMKAAMSKAEYAALKPFKPTEMMNATKEQRRAIFQELGVGKEADDAHANGEADYMDVQLAVGSSAVVLTDQAHPDAQGHDHLRQLVFRIGTTRARVTMRSNSQRLECQVASIVLLDDSGQHSEQGDSVSWHDGQALSILAGPDDDHAIALVMDTVGTDGRGEVECLVGPVSITYSKPAHLFMLAIADELSSQSVDDGTYGFVSQARSRVGRFSERAKRQLKSRLHRTQTKRFAVSIAAVIFTLPVDIEDETSPAMRVTLDALSARSKSHATVKDEATAGKSDQGSLDRASSASPESLDPDVVDRLYQRFDIGCEGLHASMLTGRSEPEQIVVPSCKLVVDIAVMLVNEIQIDGESLTAGLPWYEVVVHVEGLDISLTADQLPVAIAIAQTVHTRSTAAKSVSGTNGRDADAVWPMHTRVQLSFGDVAVELKTEETVILGRIENVELEKKVDFGQQSWTTLDVSSFAVLCRSDQHEEQTLLATGSESEVAVSVSLISVYGSRNDVCDVALLVTYRSSCTVAIPQPNIMRMFVPGLREFCGLVVLPPSPVMISPRQMEVIHGTRNIEVLIHSISIRLPTDDAAQDLLVLTANSIALTQESFERAVSYQCTFADIGFHTDVELECSTGQLPGSFFRCGHCSEGGPGFSAELDSVFSEEHGRFGIRGMVLRLSGVYVLLSNAFQARVVGYIAKWQEVLGTGNEVSDMERRSAILAQEAADAAELVLAAKQKRLAKLTDPAVQSLHIEPIETDDTYDTFVDANMDLQVDEAQIFVPSTTPGQGIKLDLGSLRLTKPANVGSKVKLDLPAVQLYSLRSSSEPMLQRAVSVALTVSVSSPNSVDGQSGLKSGKMSCKLSAVDFVLAKDNITDLSDAADFVQQSTVVARITREKTAEWSVTLACPLVSIATVNEHGKELISVDILDILLKTDTHEVSLEAGGLCAACTIEDGTAVDVVQLEKLETALASAVVIHYIKGDEPQLSVQLGDLEFIMSPEVVHALLVPHHMMPFADDSDTVTFEHAPHGNDFVLTQDDMITCDMTLSASQRLFVSGEPGQTMRLQGNGYSLRFDGTGSSSLVFVSTGTTLFLDDTVLENWDHERVELAPGSRILGVVELVDECTLPVPQSPRLLPAGLISRMRSVSKPVEEPISTPVQDEPAPLPDTPEAQLVPVEVMVASCRVRFVVPSPKPSDVSARQAMHQRARSEDIRSMTELSNVRLRTNSVDEASAESQTNSGRHRRTPSLTSRRSYSIDASARLKLSFKPTACADGPSRLDARMVIDGFCSSVSSIVKGKSVLSTKLNQPLTVVLDGSIDDSRVRCGLEIVDGIVVRLTSDAVSRAGYVVLCACDMWEEIGLHQVPGSAAAAGMVKDSQLSVGSVTISSVVIELVDPSAVSFCRCSLLNCFLQVSYAYPSRDTFLRVVASAECFNGAVSAWEPLLEKCHIFAVSKHTDDHDTDRSEVELNVRSSNGILLNVTRNLMAMYDRVLLPWGTSIRMRDPDALALLTPDASFTIRNDTRKRICISLPTSRGTVDYNMLPTEKIQYDGASLTETGAMATIARRVQINCEGCSGSIALDRVGVSHLLLESPDKSHNVHIGVQVVQTQATAKRVYIRSEVFVQNQTALRVVVRLGRKSDSPVVVIGPFSNATCATHDVMAVAPCDERGNATHEWVRVHDTQVANDRTGFVNDRVQLVTCMPLSSCEDGGILLEGKLMYFKEPSRTQRDGVSSDAYGTWKERYMQLHAGGVLTYSAEPGTKQLGRIVPVSVESKKADASGEEELFVVHSDHARAYTYATQSEDECAAWVEALVSQIRTREPEPEPEPESELEPEPEPEPHAQLEVDVPVIAAEKRTNAQVNAVKLQSSLRTKMVKHKEVNLLWHCEDGSVSGGPCSYRIQSPLTIQNRLQSQIRCFFMLKKYDAVELYRTERLPSCILEAGEDVELLYPSAVLMKLLVDKFEVSLDTVVDEPGQISVKDAWGQTLNIEMDSHVTEEGRTVVTLYASTWIVNYTGLPLRYWHSSSAGQPRESCALAGVPHEGIISPQRLTLCDAETIQISVVGELNMFALHQDDTAWSQPFNLTSVGTTGAVSIEDLPRTDGIPQHRYDLVVANRLGKGKYRRTRIVAISAQYQLLNHLEQPLFYIQADKQSLRAAAGGLAVPPHVSTPVYFRNAHGKPYLYLRTDSADTERWSSGVALDSACNLALAIPTGAEDVHTEDDNPEALVRLDCQEPGASGSQILLVRPFEREHTGYLVENHTSYSLSLWQHGLPMRVGQRMRTLEVGPHRAEPFVWEQPLMQQIVKLELSGAAASANGESGEQSRLQFQMLASFDDFVERDPVYWAPANAQVLTQVRVRGGTKVLRVSTRPGLLETPTVPPALPDTQATADDPIDAADSAEGGTSTNARTALPRQQSNFNRQSRPVFVSVELVLPSLQVAIVDRSPGPREIFALCLSDLKLQADVHLGVDVKVDASIAAVQIEDASLSARFPVMFGATDSSTGTPFLQLSLIKSLEDSSSHSYPFISVLMQAASLTLEDSFLSRVVRFFSDESLLFGGQRSDGENSDQQQDTSPSRTTSSASPVTQAGHSAVWNADGSMDKFSLTDATELHDVKPMYCKVLQLHPIQISVTFVTTGVTFEGTPVIIPFLSDVEDACLRLDALVLENTHTTPPRLAQAVAARYRQQLSYEFYKMIGTADLLGNPIGLIDSLATGVFALFYEPAAAVFKHPADITIEDLAGGLAKGMGALIHNSIHAPMNSVSKVTGTVSKSMAKLSGDEDYLLSRSNSRRRANMRSGHLGHGLRAGAEGLAKGIGHGLGGLVTAPAQAVQKQGFWGLGSGFRKGLTGAVVKPAVGAIDMAEGLTTGIRNTATIINTAAGRGPGERRRLRPPRAPGGADDERAALSAYDASLARGYASLRSGESVVAHSRRGGAALDVAGGDGSGGSVSGEGGVVMLTDSRLLLMDDEQSPSADGPTVEVELTSINSVAKSPPGSSGESGLLVRTKPVAAAWIDQWLTSSTGGAAAQVVEANPQGATILVVLDDDDVEEFTSLVSCQMARAVR
jgi:hypothetical protein